MLPIKSALPLLLSGAVLSSSAFAAPSVYPTGVTRYDPDRAFNQYVIFSGADKRTHLIDMNGNEVKAWAQAGFPSAIIDPQLVGGKRGHVLLQLSDKDPGKLGSAGNGLGTPARPRVGDAQVHAGCHAPRLHAAASRDRARSRRRGGG